MNPPSPVRKVDRALLKALGALKLLGRGVLDLLYPPHCILCLTQTAAGQHVCPQCMAKSPPLGGSCCERCAQPFEGTFAETMSGSFICSACRERKFAVDAAAAARAFQGPARELIHRFKYQHQLYLRHLLGEWLLEAMAAPRLSCPLPDALVPIPLHPARQRERGFNQAEVLARVASKRSGIPILHALKRLRFTATQTRLDREARIENLRNAFGMLQSVEVRNRHLLLIDDVLTTGSTLHECARVLKAAGAASVRAAAVLRG